MSQRRIEHRRNDFIKKPISFILTICMVFAMMPMMSITASAAVPTEVYVGDTNVIGSGITYWINDPKTGGLKSNDEANENNYNVKYDPTGILTLSGASITKPYHYGYGANDRCGIYSNGEITIINVGVNVIDNAGYSPGNSYGIRGSSGNLTISGSGILNITSGNGSNSCAIFTLSNVTISGITFNATSGQARSFNSEAITAYYTINISNSTVTAISGQANMRSCGIYSSDEDINISGSTVTATGYSSAISTVPAISGGPSPTITASVSPDGINPEVYNSNNFVNYKYLKVEFVEAKPAATVDYTNEKLTGLTPSAVYTVNEADKTASNTGAITIENSWFGTTLSLVKKGVGPILNSTAQSITLAARPATPTCTAIQPSASSATGTITGITTAMQYSTDNGSSWTDGTGYDISGIAPGTVLIRVKATGTAPASLIQTITITAYSAPSSGGGGGGSKGSTPAPETMIESGGSLPGTTVEKLVAEKKSLTVEGKTGEKLVFDPEALKTIAEQATDSIKVEVKDVSAEYKDEHPDRLVVSLTITAGDKRISSFGDGTATVSLPYELKPGERAEDVTVWYLADDGSMSEVPCTYDPTAKLVTFKVNHFSLYVVGTADTGKWVNPFRDVKESSWYYDAVRYVSANKLMQGTEDTIFNPRAKTTRGMIVTILWRMENEPKTAKEITFTDVKAGKYYHDAVAWASEKEIVGGYSAEQFGPEDNITREQLAVILHNYAKSKGYNMVASGTPSGDLPANLAAFSDSGKIHSWAMDALSWANTEGLITGTGDNLLDPRGAAERCQVAAILQRFVETTAKQ